MRCDEILGQRSIEISEKEFPMISTRISTNLSDRLWFDSLPYPKSFMSLMWMKDYTYMEEGSISEFLHTPYLLVYVV